jgi:hypothetical protein
MFRRLIAAVAITVSFALGAAVADAQVTQVAAARFATVNLAEIARSAALRSPAIEPSLQMQSRHAAAVNLRVPAAARSSAALADARRHAALLTLPRVVSLPFAGPRAPQIFGFNGLNALDTAIGQGLDVNAPSLGFGLEPPDQGLCVGNGKIVEMTNLEMAVYDTSGNPTFGPLTLSSVFGVPSSDFISDPKCYYDRPTNSFYMTLTDLTDLTTQSWLLVAVMPASLTNITDYRIDTTDDGAGGTPIHNGCPCFGDQPLLGADANAIFVSTNEFSQPNLPIVFNGAQIYAISKSDLTSAVTTPRVYSITGGIPLGEDLAASVQPATSPDGVFDSDNGGTEFFMGSLDFAGAGDNRVAVWAMTNTCMLASSPCAGLLGFTLRPPILHTRTYALPPAANQRAGPIPFGNATGNPLEQIDANDDRMGQVVYAHRRLYAALDTLVLVRGVAHAGIEYFIVKPTFHTRVSAKFINLSFSARLLRSGYVAHAATDIYYPSIGVTERGKAIMVFSLSGTELYSSAGWIPIAGTGLRQIHIAAAGAGPDDGFSGYPSENSLGSDVARWGDYSTAVADGDNIWMASEYIPSACTDAQYALDPLCGLTRAPEANWGTFISEFVTRGGSFCQPFNPCTPGETP